MKPYRRRLRKKQRTRPKIMWKKLLGSLAKMPWVARQITKASAYVGGVAAPVLSKAQVTINGETVDVFTSQQELAIVAGIVAIVSGGLELLASYAKHVATLPNDPPTSDF